MPGPRPDPAMLDDRRRQVAALKLRGLRMREISEALAQMDPPRVNPKTGKEWSVRTIWLDVEHLKKEWKQDSAEDFAAHRARVLAELREIRRRAWQGNRLETVINALDREIKMFGLNAPVKVAQTNTDGEDVPGMDLSKLSAQQLEVLAAAYGLSGN